MNTVIHYPNAPTPEWLRLAALCWDKVYWFRFYDHMADDWKYKIYKELAQELGVVLDDIDGDEFKIRHPELSKELYKWTCTRAMERFGLDLKKVPGRFDVGAIARVLEDGKPVDSDSIISDYSCQLSESNISWETIADERKVVFAQAQGLYALEAAKADNRDLSTTNEGYTDAIFCDERALRGEVIPKV